MKKILNIFQLLLIILINLIILPLATFGGLFSKKWMHFLAMGPWSKLHLWVVGCFNIEVQGMEKLDEDKPCIYVANHSSHFDIPALYSTFPFFLHFIAKKELKKIPFFGWSNTLVGTIWIDRKNKEKSMASILKAGEMIKGGKNVISFPEGTRSKTGEIGVFKKGSFSLAKQMEVDIVPIRILGTRPLNPPGTMSFSSSKIKIIIGDRIIAESFKDKNAITIANEAQEIVKNLK